MGRAEVGMSPPSAVLTAAVNNSPKGNYLGADAAAHSWHCAPSAEPWPQDKGSWKCGGWDLEQWVAVEGLLLLGGCVGGQ